jgi:hypothetical protein
MVGVQASDVYYPLKKGRQNWYYIHVVQSIGFSQGYKTVYGIVIITVMEQLQAAAQNVPEYEVLSLWSKKFRSWSG